MKKRGSVALVFMMSLSVMSVGAQEDREGNYGFHYEECIKGNRKISMMGEYESKEYYMNREYMYDNMYRNDNRSMTYEEMNEERNERGMNQEGSRRNTNQEDRSINSRRGRRVGNRKNCH